VPADSTAAVVKFTISIPRESCTNAKYSSSVVPPDPSVHFYHCLVTQPAKVTVDIILYCSNEYCKSAIVFMASSLQATVCASQHYSVPVPSHDKLGGLQQKGYSA